MRRIIYAIKKPFIFIKNKTFPQREFLRDGRLGGIIALTLLCAQFFTWLIDDGLMNKLPIVIAFLVTVILAILASELVGLGNQTCFGRQEKKRSLFHHGLFRSIRK